MSFKTTTLLGLLLVVAAFLSAVWLSPHFLISMPSHWDATGHVSGQLRRSWGMFLLPIIMAAVWCVLSLLPRNAPLGYRPNSSTGAYGSICLAILAMLFISNVFMLFAPNGKHLAMQHTIPVIVGLLLVVIGNYLGKLRKNFSAGIRTPWTLANAEVWTCTHRFGGWVFVVAGFVFVIAGLRAPSQSVPYILAAVFVLLVVVSYGSSYLFYRRVQDSGKSGLL